MVRFPCSEGQSTDANTATVNPEVSATSLNHGQHNHFRMLTTKRSELVIIIIATCIALAGLILQFKANRFSDEANELTRQGNSVAEKSYKLQLWDDCHDRQVNGASNASFTISEAYFTRICKTRLYVEVLQA